VPQLLNGGNDPFFQPHQENKNDNLLEDDQGGKENSENLDAGPAEQQIENDQVEKKHHGTRIVEIAVVPEKFALVVVKVAVQLSEGVAGILLKVPGPAAAE
jgi:hypothetical protein